MIDMQLRERAQGEQSMPDPRPAATSHHVHRVRQAVAVHELGCWGLNKEVKPPICDPDL
jgi:hypothetical protein